MNINKLNNLYNSIIKIMLNIIDNMSKVDIGSTDYHRYLIELNNCTSLLESKFNNNTVHDIYHSTTNEELFKLLQSIVLVQYRYTD